LDPGTDVLDSFGGLHNFSSWPGALLTDSGGFQMVSLLKLAEITEAGVGKKGKSKGVGGGRGGGTEEERRRSGGGAKTPIVYGCTRVIRM
jgi:hypothetical protein